MSQFTLGVVNVGGGECRGGGMSHFTLGVVNVGGGECRGGECRTIKKKYRALNCT